MTRTRIISAALAALALAAPAASADPHAIDSHTRALLEQQELRSTDAATRALEQERTYSTYGEPTPIPPRAAPTQVTTNDDAPWALIAFGIAAAALIAVGVVVNARRSRVAT